MTPDDRHRYERAWAQKNEWRAGSPEPDRSGVRTEWRFADPSQDVQPPRTYTCPPWEVLIERGIASAMVVESIYRGDVLQRKCLYEARLGW